MPLIAYSCECGTVTKKFFRQAKDAPAFFTCKCNKNAKKSLSSPSSLSKITVDNGIQAKSVEIIPNIVELMEERSEKNNRGD